MLDLFSYRLGQKRGGGSGGGGEVLLQEKTATANGTVLPDSGFDGLSQVVVDVPQTVDSAEDSIIDRSIAGAYVNGRVTSIGTYAFRSCAALTMANFPLVTSIGTYAFQSCSRLTTANFPQATSIDTYAFHGCSALTTANFPQATSIGTYAFYGCPALTTADFPQATSIGSYAFHECAALTTADFPQATSIGTYAFQSCSRLTTADFPLVTEVDRNAFYGCVALAVLALRNTESVCTLSNVNAFTGTLFASGNAGGKLLVPAALVTEYQNATNWTTLYGYGHNKFLALEDYTVDGTTTSEIDWDKLNAA